MTKEDLKTLIRIAQHVIKEQPIWISESLKVDIEEIKRLHKQLLWDKVIDK
tara:strand:+ start:90 stop:242 length:153 start_codon:yes stop_codon:yes gene_type:complete